MAKKLTIQVSDEFYARLQHRIGKRGIGRFLEEVATPHLVGHDRDAEYRSMAADEEREREAREWLDADLGDTLPEEDWSWLRDATR
jgi:hypothetical protein